MLPDQPGTYVLILNLPRPVTLRIGRLGRFQFPAGRYAYVGSACGPGGLAARLRRHLRTSKTLRWHVDYLRAHACPVQVWYAVGSRDRECAWAQTLAELPGASIPVPRFGASDCRCPAHLVHFAASPDPAAFARALSIIRSPKAVPTLYAALDDPSAAVAYYTEEALEKMGIGLALFQP